MMRVDFLENVPLFNTCGSAFIEAVVQKFKLFVYLPGDSLIQQGAIGKEVFFIRIGEVAVLKNDRRRRAGRISSTEHPGTYVVYSSLFSFFK